MVEPFCGHYGNNLDDWIIVQNDFYIHPEGTLEAQIPTSHITWRQPRARSPAGLSVQCSFLCPSVSPPGPLLVPSLPAVHGLYYPWGSTQVGCTRVSPQSPAQYPTLGALVDLMETSLLGPLNFCPLWRLVVIFIHLNGPAHPRNVLETWSCLGIGCLHLPPHCSFQSRLFL